MPEHKKSKTVRNFDAQADDQLLGLHLVRAQRPVAPQAKPAAAGRVKPGEPLAGEIHAPEPDVVTKLIDFIKSI